MGSFLSFLKRNYTSLNPPTPPRSPNGKPSIRIGILSTASITHMALILPAKSHPGVEVVAIGGRDKKKTEGSAKKWGIGRVYWNDADGDGYQKLIDDPEIDAVYIPLPHVHHYEWTMKALSAGKHVLVEKPIANTPEEAVKMHELAEEKGVVLLEGMHPRFHPALNRVKEIIESGELGAVKHITASQRLPKGLLGPFKSADEIKLGRGATNDVGCYCIEISRFLAPSSSSPSPRKISVQSASPNLWNPAFTNLDKSALVSLSFSNSNVSALLKYDLSMPLRRLWGLIPVPDWDFSVEVQCENGNVRLSDFMGPQMVHSITVVRNDPDTSASGKGKTGKSSRVETAYTYSSLRAQPSTFDHSSKGEEWWTTFRHQLEAFVDRIEGRTPRNWVGKEESVEQAVLVKEVYEKMGMQPRPPSEYFVKTTSVST